MNQLAGDSVPSAVPRSKRWLIRAGLLIGLTIGLGVWAWPWAMKQKKLADRTTAISSLKVLSLGLQEFRSQFGRYPDESTATIVKTATSTPLDLSGSSSNRLFRQLIATGLRSEKLFYAPQPGHRPGDDRFDDDSHALAPGEVGFAYLTSEASGEWAPSAIIAAAPLIHGTTRFDSEPYGGFAVSLRNDDTVVVLRIGPDGQAMTMEGKNILGPDQEYWNGHPPVIHWCEEPEISH